MMLFRYILPALLIFIAGCSSSEPEQNQPQHPNLISINPPESPQVSDSKMYVDSVKMINYKEKKALLITGNMANGCTYLRDASHTASADSLTLSLKAWKPADKICSQALVPFSFIYDEIPAQILETHSSATINQQSFKILKK